MFKSAYHNYNQLDITAQIGVVSFICRNSKDLKSLEGHALIVFEYISNNEEETKVLEHQELEAFDYGMLDNWLFYSKDVIPNRGVSKFRMMYTQCGFYAKSFYGVPGIIRSSKKPLNVDNGDDFLMLPNEYKLTETDLIKSWPIERETILSVVRLIRCEQFNPPIYRVFFRQKNQHHCATWVLEKLKLLGDTAITTALANICPEASPIAIALHINATPISTEQNHYARLASTLASYHPRCVLL